MPDPDRVRYARRFTARTAGHPDIHGIQFPSGHVIYDQPDIGLEAATSIQYIRGYTPDTRIHWADEEQP